MKVCIDSVSKMFQNVRALDVVSVEFAAGEIHSLVGENGAGKSTLVRIITGVHRPDSGVVKLDGNPVRFGSPRDALAAGIGAVHQERNLIPHFSVGENILLERLPTGNGFVDYKAIDARASEMLDILDPGIDVRSDVSSMSVAHMQLIEIAKALSLNARALLFDEPTDSITKHGAAALVKVLRRLSSAGVAIVFVSHKLDEVLVFSDRVSVLRGGRVVASNEPIAEMSRPRLVSLMIGREERIAQIGHGCGVIGDVALELTSVATSYGHRGIDLTLRKTEVLGLYGLVGAGRTEHARAIVGVGKIISGEVVVRGRRVTVHNPYEALARHRIGYVSEDRKDEGLILSHGVRSNIAMTVWRAIASMFKLLNRTTEATVANSYVRKLAIRISSLDQMVSTLSGGNQQKVSIAKWLAAATDTLILDEPTVGIDIKTKVELHELIDELARQDQTDLLQLERGCLA
jgi:ribose transport system ATP-binding protein